MKQRTNKFKQSTVQITSVKFHKLFDDRLFIDGQTQEISDQCFKKKIK